VEKTSNSSSGVDTKKADSARQIKEQKMEIEKGEEKKNNKEKRGETGGD